MRIFEHGKNSGAKPPRQDCREDFHEGCGQDCREDCRGGCSQSFREGCREGYDEELSSLSLPMISFGVVIRDLCGLVRCVDEVITEGSSPRHCRRSALHT